MGKNKKKNIIAKLGTHNIIKESGNGFEYIRIKSISENWSLTFRSDSRMYGLWEIMCQDPQYHKGAEVLITMFYLLSNTHLDSDFIDTFFKEFSAMNKRATERISEASEKEQELAREEVDILERPL